MARAIGGGGDPSGRRRLLGQCHRLGKTVLVVLPLRCLRTSPQTARRRTCPDPHSGRTQNVSCFALFTMSVPDVAIRAVSASCRLARAIGQEGSFRDEPANRIVSADFAAPPQEPLVEPVAPKARSPKTRQAEPRSGGAYRDRTGDLMLAKHALSQLS